MSFVFGGCTKKAGDEPTKTTVNVMSNKTSLKPSCLTIPGIQYFYFNYPLGEHQSLLLYYFFVVHYFTISGTMKEQNVNVNVSGNQIRLISAGTGKSLNLKGIL